MLYLWFIIVVAIIDILAVVTLLAIFWLLIFNFIVFWLLEYQPDAFESVGIYFGDSYVVIFIQVP